MSVYDLNKLPDLDNADFKPLYVQLYDILNDFIKSYNISPNTLLPSEKDLMDRYGISRPTVRQAFQKLEAEHSIHRIRGKGTFLSDLIDNKNLYSMFSAEERFAAEGITVKSISLEISKIHPLKDWSEELQLGRNEKVCRIRRLKLIEDKPFAIKERIFPLKVAKLVNADDLKDKLIYNLINMLPGIEINRIQYTFKSRKIKNKEAKELKTAFNTPVLVRKGLYYTTRGKPVMISHTINLPEIHEFEFVLHKRKNNWLVVKSQ